jgi:Dyp-type peroxidase family
MTSLHELANPIRKDQIDGLRESLESLQGNILQGHERNHAVHICLRFKADKQTEVKQWIMELAKDLTSAQQQFDEIEQYRQYGIPGRLFMSFLLSAKGYEYFNLVFPEKHIPQKNSLFNNEDNWAFLWGMKAAQDLLHDPLWACWEEGYQQDIHAMVLLADDDKPFLQREVYKLLDRVKVHAEICTVERGMVMRNAQGYTVEHFGYVDGRSQPLFFQRDIERERQQEKGPTVWDSSAGPNLVLVPDPHGRRDYDSGSYLVFRKLEQDVRAFKEYEQKLAQTLDLIGENAARAEALIMGRFRDGTPLVCQPIAGQSDPVPNNFTYSDDPDGRKCPFQAHIRKVNPRNDDARRRRIVRRGITYGKREKGLQDTPSLEELPVQGVGLLFMCYQRNIEQQFEFLHGAWANTPDLPEQGAGIDPVIGQHGGRLKTELGQQKWPAQWNTPRETHMSFSFSGFVTLKGGEYFFMPSIYFLKNIGNEVG